MRTITLLLWLTIPILMAAYDFGPGQRQLRLDATDGHIAKAEAAAAASEWTDAVAHYEAALGSLPADHKAVDRRLRLERAKVQMQCQKLSTAHGDLKGLVDELTADQTAEPQLVADAQAALANSQYYMTWLMRLEGQPKTKWEPEIEAARQTFRRLAESATGSSTGQKNRADLESVIKLARMDLGELQGLPLPNQ